MVLTLSNRDLRSIEELARRLESQGLVAESQTLRDIIHTGGTRREVRASIAAKALHVTPQTIRNWVKRGRIDGRIDGTRHIFVKTEALRPALDLDSAMPYSSASESDAGIDDILNEIRIVRSSEPPA